MKLVLDECTSTTGWTRSSSTLITLSTNEIPEYIANDNITSLLIKWKAGSLNQYIEKLITKDVTDYTDIIMSLWSQQFKWAGTSYSLKTDFKYKIEFYSGMTPILLPLYNGLTDITIDCRAMTNLTKIKITCLHNVEDYLVISHIVAVQPELPLDIYLSLLSKLESEVTTQISSNGIAIGALTGSAGDKKINITGNRYYLDKYAVVKIVDGSHSETHQIWDNDEADYLLGQIYDGTALLYSYTGATVYLTLPVSYSRIENETIMPCMSIGGFDKENFKRSSDIQDIRDSYNNSESVASRRDYVNYKYTIDIVCQARQHELVALCNQIVSNVLARRYLWINGRKFDIDFASPNTYTLNEQSYNNLPSIVWKMIIEVREDVWPRNTLVKTTDIDIDVEVVEQGDI